MKDKEKKMLFGIGIVFLFLATVGFSYAYFTASIANKDVKDQVVTTGTLELTYTDGPEIKMLNIKPGTTFTKEVSVKNTGTLDTAYNLAWQELNNEIMDDEMVISATCERRNANGEIEETCEGLSETAIGANIIKKNIAIESGVTHKYVITITFKETSADQNYNQNKKFSGVLGINEYKDNSPAAVYCTFDGELTQGAEYVNGQYTYRYMQAGKYSSELAWENITKDGWGVQLTDRTSTDHVTSKVCTYINNKPVVSMAYMFFLSQASEINLNDVNTSNVLDMSRMFNDTKATKINLNNIDTSNVTDMSYMFASSQATILDVSKFDTSSVTNMGRMFSGSKATTLDVSNFDTSNVTTMEGMFSYTSATTLDLSNFDTSKVINMKDMFEYSQATTLNLSSFNTSNVTDMSYMFAKSYKLTTIYVSNKFLTNKVTSSSSMFGWDTKLVGGAGTVYDSSNIDKTYARVDGGTSSPGYFTLKTN